MLAELGQFTLILAFLAAIIQALFPFVGLMQRDDGLRAIARSAALAQGALVVSAFACLMALHATSDFSVANVVENSHSAKPFVYKLSGVWGNHEGSMLLWVLILSLYGATAARFSRNRRSSLTSTALAVQGAVAAAFIAFILFTSNPFERIFPPPADGADLNPLLQDPGLAVHPPFLYLGYVGFSITFAYAIAGLIERRIDADWARTVRPWALAAWMFLTIGIALGSWWAYYELGWGGFWAWDPVENASFMPWLAGTAFLHSVRVVEKREALKVWTVLLAILAFSLSLIGTFLVRSGILTSVHAFAVDPARGVFILAILSAVIGGSFALFAVRGALLKSTSTFQPVSREGAILLNNVLLMTACGTVFIGTFYPLFVDIVSGERISVGPPFFNATFLPIIALLLFVLAPGAALAWKRGDLKRACAQFWTAAIAGCAFFAIAAWLTWPKPVAAAFGAGLAVWVFAATLADLSSRIKLGDGPLSAAYARLKALPPSYAGMIVAHIGLAIVALGVLGAGVWRTEAVQLMNTGDVIRVGAYDARLIDVADFAGPNFAAEHAVFRIEKNGAAIRELIAERRFYPVRGMQTTEAGIWTTLAGDVYLTLGERTAGAGWAVRAYYHPLVALLWFGAGVMAFGGILAGFDRLPTRRRVGAPQKAAVLGAAT
ncbi:MAG: heme lyase CcmF/NrfE family subunit [Parvularculaceae bacterium]|nr:heme lyase CcmF/NrfE family subunit [Parvularculaceae bacterium]